MKELFAKCGTHCGGCPGYHENAKTEADRQRCSDGWHRYLGVRVRPDLIHCQGCQAPDPWKSGDILPNRVQQRLASSRSGPGTQPVQRS